MSYYLYQYDTGDKFAPASQENMDAYTKALQEGKTYITVGYHGYSLKMTVRKDKSVAEEKALFGVTEPNK